MASGVSVNSDPAPAISPDLAAAVDGGENFVKRLAALQQAKKDAEAALAELTVGKSIAAARAELVQMKAEADRYVADARARADQMIAKAVARLEVLTKIAEIAEE